MFIFTAKNFTQKHRKKFFGKEIFIKIKEKFKRKKKSTVKMHFTDRKLVFKEFQEFKEILKIIV